MTSKSNLLEIYLDEALKNAFERGGIEAVKIKFYRRFPRDVLERIHWLPDLARAIVKVNLTKKQCKQDIFDAKESLRSHALEKIDLATKREELICSTEKTLQEWQDQIELVTTTAHEKLNAFANQAYLLEEMINVSSLDPESLQLEKTDLAMKRKEFIRSTEETLQELQDQIELAKTTIHEKLDTFGNQEYLLEESIHASRSDLANSTKKLEQLLAEEKVLHMLHHYKGKNLLSYLPLAEVQQFVGLETKHDAYKLKEAEVLSKLLTLQRLGFEANPSLKKIREEDASFRKKYPQKDILTGAFSPRTGVPGPTQRLVDYLQLQDPPIEHDSKPRAVVAPDGSDVVSAIFKSPEAMQQLMASPAFKGLVMNVASSLKRKADEQEEIENAHKAKRAKKSSGASYDATTCPPVSAIMFSPTTNARRLLFEQEERLDADAAADDDDADDADADADAAEYASKKQTPSHSDA